MAHTQQQMDNSIARLLESDRQADTDSAVSFTWHSDTTVHSLAILVMLLSHADIRKIGSHNHATCPAMHQFFGSGVTWIRFIVVWSNVDTTILRPGVRVTGLEAKLQDPLLSIF